MFVLLVIVLLGSVVEVQVVVCWVNEYGVVIVLFGGCIGFFGGVVVVYGELVLSLECMNQVLVFDVVDCMFIVQVGMLLQVVQDVVKVQGLIYLVDFVVCGLCLIGGNIVINVGGICVICYGNMCEWIVGFIVVIGIGEVLEFNCGLIKNFSGYDLCQLMIVFEGILGIVVEVMLKFIDLFLFLQVMLLVLLDMDVLMQVFVLFCLWLVLQVFEFFIDVVLCYVLVYGVQCVIEGDYLFYVVIEFDVVDEWVQEVVLIVFEEGVEQGWISDGVIVQSDVQVVVLWCLCEGIIESVVLCWFYKNDVFVWISVVFDFLYVMQVLFICEYLQFEVVWFGYIGDGNLYINVLILLGMDDVVFIVQCEYVIKYFVVMLYQFGGSILVEYGIGLVKWVYLESICSVVEIVLMCGVWQVFDLYGIFNFGKFFVLLLFDGVY